MSSQVLSAMPYTAGQVIRTPVWPVSVASAGVMGALLLALAEIFGDQEGNLAVSAAGYVLGSLVTTVFVVVHRLFKQRAAREVWFSPRPQLDRIAHGLLVAGLACGAVHAFALATEIAKR